MKLCGMSTSCLKRDLVKTMMQRLQRTTKRGHHHDVIHDNLESAIEVILSKKYCSRQALQREVLVRLTPMSLSDAWSSPPRF